MKKRHRHSLEREDPVPVQKQEVFAKEYLRSLETEQKQQQEQPEEQQETE